MDQTAAAIVDLPDGSFQILPNARAARFARLLAIYGVVVTVGLGLVLPVVAAARHQGGMLFFGLVLLALAIGLSWLLWSVSKLPALKADRVEVSCPVRFNDQRIRRSALALVFRGQVLRRGRYSTWLKSYLFVDRDGKVAISVPELWYSAADMAAIAQRLDVPLRGDFTEKVQGSIDASLM
jgi:hypothetical protein